MNKTGKRLIVGCGYLGMPTTRIWLQRDDEVTVLTRDTEKFRSKIADIDPLHKVQLISGDITDPNSLAQLEALPPFDTVLFAVGMDRSRYQDIFSVYVAGLKNVVDRLHPQTGHFIYISSTGVYGNLSPMESAPVESSPVASTQSTLPPPIESGSEAGSGVWIDETTEAKPDREGGQACLQAESLLQTSNFADRVSILRFAGIYGPQRIPLLTAIRQQQWDRLSAEGYLNLIHVADGARIITIVADHPDRSHRQTILISDGHPVPRRTFYDYLADQVGVGSIPWDELNRSVSRQLATTTPSSATDSRRDRRTSHKKVCNQKLNDLFSYEFQFPNYQAGLIIPTKDCQSDDKRHD